MIAKHTQHEARGNGAEAARRLPLVLRLALVAVLGALAASLFVASGAHAAAYPIGVYAPERISNTQIQGWANLSRDCSGTYGCYNYIKIERSRWWGTEFVNGWWATANGWNSITATLPYGCYNYRTTTDSYNDVAGTFGSGVNIGPVGLTANGTRIYRFRQTWSSGWKQHCR
jgi:hypothetical protein